MWSVREIRRKKARARDKQEIEMLKEAVWWLQKELRDREKWYQCTMEQMSKREAEGDVTSTPGNLWLEWWKGTSEGDYGRTVTETQIMEIDHVVGFLLFLEAIKVGQAMVLSVGR